MRETLDQSKATLRTFTLAIIMLAIWVTLWATHWSLPHFWISCGLFTALVSLSWFDFDHYRIPNWISYPLILSGLCLAWLKGVPELGWHMLGAVLGYIFIWALNAYWRYRHAKDGIGMGDAKLLAAAGAWLGPLALPFVTLIASAMALLVILVSMITKRSSKPVQARIAFGPYIALGFWAMWLAGSM